MDDHTGNTESSSSSNSDIISSPISPRKSRKMPNCDTHSSPPRRKSGILRLLSERSLSPSKVSRSKRYADCAESKALTSLVPAVNEVSNFLSSQKYDTVVTETTNGSNFNDTEDAAKDDRKIHSNGVIDSACSTFKPYGHYMINQTDTSTLWVSSETSTRPHLELNITRGESPHDLMVGRSACRRKFPVRSKSLRFSLKDVEKKDTTPFRPMPPRWVRRNSMK